MNPDTWAVLHHHDDTRVDADPTAGGQGVQSEGLRPHVGARRPTRGRGGGLGNGDSYRNWAWLGHLTKAKNVNKNGAGGGGRTHTERKLHGILSPVSILVKCCYIYSYISLGRKYVSFCVRHRSVFLPLSCDFIII